MFKKDKYCIIRQAISKDLAIFIYNYFLMKKQVYDTCLKTRYISPYEFILGYYEGADQQIPNTYSCYSDIVMETLLLKCQPIMEKTTGLKLNPAYTYARIYKKGDVLKRHKDRFSCEISTTMNLGGDAWSIYLNPYQNIGRPDPNKMVFLNQKDNKEFFGQRLPDSKSKGITSTSKAKGIKVNLDPGDMLVYSGCEIEHWREKFKGKSCGQVFLHYNNRKTPGAKDNMFDKRLHLGLPSWFKK